MVSLFVGIFLLYYAILTINTPTHYGYPADRILWSLSWGLLYILNGVLGGVYNQDNLLNLVIFTYILAFLFGSHVFSVCVRGTYSSAVSIELNPTFSKIHVFIIGCSLLGLWAPYEMLSLGGVAFSGGGGDYAQQIAEINSELRTGAIEQSLLGKLSFASPQAAVICAGIYLSFGRRKLKEYISLIAISFVPLLAFTAVSTIRSPVFLAVILFATSYMVGMMMQRKEGLLFRPKIVLGAIIVGTLLMLMMVFFQSIRLGDSNMDRLDDTIQHMRIWFAGYLPAFSGWYNYVWRGDYTFGASTMKFAASLIRGKTSYVDSLQSNIFIGDFRYGNASTCFRVIVNDFGLFGCGIFVVIWGAVSSWLDIKTRRGSLIFASLCAVNLVCVIWSVNQWYLLYGSRVMGVLIVLVYLVCFCKIRLTELAREI